MEKLTLTLVVLWSDLSGFFGAKNITTWNFVLGPIIDLSKYDIMILDALPFNYYKIQVNSKYSLVKNLNAKSYHKYWDCLIEKYVHRWTVWHNPYIPITRTLTKFVCFYEQPQRSDSGLLAIIVVCFPLQYDIIFSLTFLAQLGRLVCLQKAPLFTWQIQRVVAKMSCGRDQLDRMHARDRKSPFHLKMAASNL